MYINFSFILDKYSNLYLVKIALIPVKNDVNNLDKNNLEMKYEILIN